MNFISSLFESGMKGAGKGLKHPMAAGAAIGAGVGFFGSDGTITQRLQSAGNYAAAGAAIGGMMPFTGAGLYSKLWQGQNIIGKGVFQVGKTSLNLGISALENAVPLAAIGIGAYGASQVLGSFGQSTKSPTLEGARVRTDYNQQAMQAEEINSTFVNTPGIMGASPQYRQQMQRFQQSTIGLVNGLYQARHG